MSPEEVLPFVWPNLILVSDENISTEVFPEYLNLSRNILESTEIYAIFNTFNLYLWVGKDVSEWFLQELFGQTEGNETLVWSEEDIFHSENGIGSTYCQNLYNVL